MIDIRRQLQENEPLKIERLLIDCFAKTNPEETLRATDARDRVYGLLGLTKGCMLQPDYEKSCAEVYTQLAEQILRE